MRKQNLPVLIYLEIKETKAARIRVPHRSSTCCGCYPVCLKILAWATQPLVWELPCASCAGCQGISIVWKCSRAGKGLPRVAAGFASAAVAFHRQEDHREQQKHCAEEQGEHNVAPGGVLRAGHCQRDKGQGCHRGQLLFWVMGVSKIIVPRSSDTYSTCISI